MGLKPHLPYKTPKGPNIYPFKYFESRILEDESAGFVCAENWKEQQRQSSIIHHPGAS